LIGFMGTGKTTVGRRLAAELGWRFVDTDAEVERATGLTIPEIFARWGEARFRKEESRAVARVCSASAQVIATGGGAVLDPANRERLRRCGTVVWLVASPEVIQRRVGRSGSRPLLAQDGGLEHIRELLSRREPYYRALADITVDTSELSVAEVVREILGALEARATPSGEGNSGGAAPAARGDLA
jgi:shikimate kinase